MKPRATGASKTTRPSQSKPRSTGPPKTTGRSQKKPAVENRVEDSSSHAAEPARIVAATSTGSGPGAKDRSTVPVNREAAPRPVRHGDGPGRPPIAAPI
jgi:hypothetical protein